MATVAAGSLKEHFTTTTDTLSVAAAAPARVDSRTTTQFGTNSTEAPGSPANALDTEIRKLQQENERLAKTIEGLTPLEAENTQLRHELESSEARLAAKLKSVEKTNKSLWQEKENLQTVSSPQCFIHS